MNLHLFKVKIWIHVDEGSIIRQRYVFAHTYESARQYVTRWHRDLGEDVYCSVAEPVIPLEGVIL